MRPSVRVGVKVRDGKSGLAEVSIKVELLLRQNTLLPGRPIKHGKAFERFGVRFTVVNPQRPLSAEALAQHVCARLSRNLTDKKWREFHIDEGPRRLHVSGTAVSVDRESTRATMPRMSGGALFRSASGFFGLAAETGAPHTPCSIRPVASQVSQVDHCLDPPVRSPGKSGRRAKPVHVVVDHADRGQRPVQKAVLRIDPQRHQRGARLRTPA